MGGRVIVVGDPNQSLYRFRGADSQAFQRIEEMLGRNTRDLQVCDLPVNYRSDMAVIEHAKQWVPKLQGNSKAAGTVDELTFGEAMTRANNEGRDIALPDGIDNVARNLETATFAFLCRINLPLIVTAYQLISQGKRVCIIGRNQIGLPLKRIIEEVCGSDSNDKFYTNRISNLTDRNGNLVEEGLLSRLANWYRVQEAKLEEEKYKNKLEQLQQNIECIEVIATKVKDDKVSSVLAEIDTLFTEEATPGVISLSTIHRAKGLEWDVVFILRPDLLPHPLAKANPDGSWSDEQQQEQNAQYVAATRAKKRLYYVENWPFGNTANKTLNYESPRSNMPEENEEYTYHVGQLQTYAPPSPVMESPKNEEFIDDGQPF